MMDLDAARENVRGDQGVSPVIAVILMVAITVVLAATVYVWVSGFATDDTGPEQASATAKGLDTDDNGDVDAIRVTLTSGENAPYTLKCDESGNTGDTCNSGDGSWGSDTEFIVAGSDGNGNGYDATSLFNASGISNHWDDGQTWNVGSALYLDCNAAGTADLSISVGQSSDKTAILDTTIECDEA